MLAFMSLTATRVAWYHGVMADLNRKLVMDIVAQQPAPEPPKTKEGIFRGLRNRLSGSRFIKKSVYIFSAVIAVLAIATGVILYFHSTGTQTDALSKLIPQTIRQQVPFNLYIPDPSKLPLGYTLNIQSFSYGNDALLYKIGYGENQNLIVTVQQKPSDAAIKQFYKVHMPLTIPIQTNVGDAALGVLNNETVVSLPTNTNAWLLMTAPFNANQSQVKRVIQTMTLAK